MSYSIIPLVDSDTKLFPEPTMEALAEALPGSSPAEISELIAEYLETNPVAEPLLEAHVSDTTPHPAYDKDLQSLAIIFENGLV